MACEKYGKLELEQYFLSELTENKRREISAHTDSCQTCKAFLENLQGEKEDYLALHPFGQVEDKLLQPEKKQGLGWFGFGPRMAWAGGFAMLLVMATAVMVPQFIGKGPDQIRYKGKALSLDFICKRDGMVNPGDQDGIYYEGDEIQFTYSAGKFNCMVLASLDTAGKISIYHDSMPGNMVGLEVSRSGKAMEYFPHSIYLDNAQEAELFVAIFANKQISRSQLSLWLTGLYSRSGKSLAAMEKSVPEDHTFQHAETRSILLKKGIR